MMAACLSQQSLGFDRVDFKGASGELLPSFHDYLCLLQKGKESRDVLYASNVNTHMHAAGLEIHHTVGSRLVGLLAGCGCISNAQQVFHKLPTRCEFGWTFLIQGYTESGDYLRALALYTDMQAHHVNPTEHTLKALLKASTAVECFQTSFELHHAIVKDGFDEDLFIGSSVVNLYVKCALLEEAHDVFDELEDRDVMVWNFLLAGYLRQGFDLKVLHCFIAMQSDGVQPNSITYVCVIKACCSLGALEDGQSLHINIITDGFEGIVELGNTLVDMYARCALFEEALDVMDKMPIRDVITWSALIAGYSDYGLAEEALHTLCWMKSTDVHPNSVTYSCCVKACSRAGALKEGLEVHAEITAEGYESDVFVTSSLLDFYLTCGMYNEAQEVFEGCEAPDTASWNALTSGNLKHRLFEEVLNSFDHLHLQGIQPDSITFMNCLKACGGLSALRRGQKLHSEIIKKGYEEVAYLGNSLVDMYLKCKSFTDAYNVFGKLPEPDVVSWNTLMAGFVELGLFEDTLEVFAKLQREGISPTIVTFLIAVQACGKIAAPDIGNNIHAEVVKYGLENDPFLINALVTFYAESGCLAEALQLFDELTEDNAGKGLKFLMERYADSHKGKESFQILNSMGLEGTPEGLILTLCTLKSCVGLKDIDRAFALHLKIVKEGLDRDHLVANLLLDTFCNCVFLDEAQYVFDEFGAYWSAVEWSCFIAGHVDAGEVEKALTLFSRMQEHGLIPLNKTFLSLIQLCGNNLAIDTGKRLHAQVVNFSQEELIHRMTATTLIDMYGKFGSTLDAERAFETITCKDLVSWSALFGVYVCQGQCELVLASFNSLRAERILPDAIIFVSILTACSHAGLVIDGQDCFTMMTKEYKLLAVTEHYNCMVDLLSRAGRFEEAVTLIQGMPIKPDYSTFNCVVGASSDWSFVKQHRKTLQHELQHILLWTLNRWTDTILED